MTYKEAFVKLVESHPDEWAKMGKIAKFYLKYISGPIAWHCGKIAGTFEALKYLWKGQE